MTKTFSDHDLSNADFMALVCKALEGDVPSSMVILASMGEKLATLTSDEIADISLSLGAMGDYIEVAIANINVWYRDEYPASIDSAISDAKFSALTAE